MAPASLFLNASQAARRLGVSVKALRLYEQRGLVMPPRTSAGWRAYGPAQMARASEIVALRSLGFSLRHVARLLAGDGEMLAQTLATQEARLTGQIRQLNDTLAQVKSLKDALAESGARDALDARFAEPATEPVLAFNLPWPWGGERFELYRVKRLNYITGPLGSGKTRLAHAIAEHLPGAVFLGLERLADIGRETPALSPRVAQALARVLKAGGTQSHALMALLIALEAGNANPLVIDMVEQGLDEASQQALVACLREGGAGKRTLFMLTRSRAILDLDCATAEEQVIFCPANHSPPTVV